MSAVDSPTLAGAMTWPQAAHQAAHQDPLASSMDDDPRLARPRGVGTPDTGRDSPTGGHPSPAPTWSRSDSRPALASASTCSSTTPAHSPARSMWPSSLSLSCPDDEETRELLAVVALSPPMSTVQSPYSAWNNGRAASSVTVAVDTFGSSQTSPASSQYNTPARHSAVCPTNGPGRVVGKSSVTCLNRPDSEAVREPSSANPISGLMDSFPNQGSDSFVAASVLNATPADTPGGRTNARIETSPMDPLTSSAVDLGIQIGPNSRNSPTLLSQTAASKGATLCGPRPKNIALVLVILLLIWGSFIWGCHLQKRMTGLEKQVQSLTQDLQELHVKHILNQEEISRQFKQMRLRLTIKESSKAPKMWKPKKIHSSKPGSTSPSLIDTGLKIASTTSVSSSPSLPVATTPHGDFRTKTDSFFGNLFGKELSPRTTTRSPSHIVPCSTENGVSCVFPFNYQGQNQTKCLKSLLPGKTWCPIKLQPDGTFIQQPDAWDYCRPGCS